MVGATHIAASAMPLADMRYRDRRDQRESVGAGNGNCSLTDGRNRPKWDDPVGRSQPRKRTSVHHDDRVRNVRDRDVISGRAFPAVLGRNTSLQIPGGMQQVLLEKCATFRCTSQLVARHFLVLTVRDR